MGRWSIPFGGSRTAENMRKALGGGLIVSSAAVTLFLLWEMAFFVSGGVEPEPVQFDVLDRFDRFIAGRIDFELGESALVRQTYILEDSDLVAPEPNPEGYGTAEDPSQLQWLLDAAQELLAGQQTLFTAQTPVLENSVIRYYLDDTIFAVTWKQPIENTMYTFSEIKIAHASQFRRFLSNGKFGSGVLYTTTEMAQSVNAVVASSGDYYEYRSIGVVVMDGVVYRSRGELLDTCYIDDNGELLFTYAGQITDMESAQAFVDENHIRFSVSFGPVLIKDGELCVPGYYNSGEINDKHARAALCQLGPLHYLLVTANTETPCYAMPTLHTFANCLWELGIPTAYALDGGQTATIAMDNEMINFVSYGSQRKISDILYFATAMP